MGPNPAPQPPSPPNPAPPRRLVDGRHDVCSPELVKCIGKSNTTVTFKIRCCGKVVVYSHAELSDTPSKVLKP